MKSTRLVIIAVALSKEIISQEIIMLEDAKDSLERIREGLAAKGESL